MSIEKMKQEFPWERITRSIDDLEGHRPSVECVFQPFDHGMQVEPDVLAALHSELLSRSPATKLGIDFLQSFYYDTLVRDGHIWGGVAYIDGEPAAFWATTQDSNGFMSRALRRRFLRLSWVLLRTVLSNPSSMRGILEARRLMGARKPSDEYLAEGLSSGIRPRFRNREFKMRTGLFLVDELSKMVMAEHSRRGTKLMCAFVDADNESCHRFKARQGWTRVKTDHSGWKELSVEYRVRPEDHFAWQYKEGATEPSPGSETNDH